MKESYLSLQLKYLPSFILFANGYIYHIKIKYQWIMILFLSVNKRVYMFLQDTHSTNQPKIDCLKHWNT